MQPIKYYQLKHEINNNKIFPLYFFYGPEEFLKEEITREIVNKFITAENKAFCVDTVEGSDLTLSHFSSISQGLSIFGDRRIIIVYNTDDVPSAIGEDLIPFLNEIPDNVCVIFTSSEYKFKKKDILISELQKKAHPVVFWQLSQSAMEIWVKEYVKKNGFTTDEKTIRELIAVSNEDVRILKSELDKIIVYLGERRQITYEDISSMRGQSRDYTIYDLDKYLYKRDIKQGLICIQGIMQVRYNGILILSYLFKAVKRLLCAKMLLKEGSYNNQEISSLLGLHRFFDKEFFEKLKNFKYDELTKGINLLIQAEDRLKSGQGTPIYILSKLWLNLCQRAQN
ncbi:MAG: DNA polymerase III subunit delta [bacterium]